LRAGGAKPPWPWKPYGLLGTGTVLFTRMRATSPAASYRRSHGSVGFCSSGEDGGELPCDAPPLGLSWPDLGSPYSVDLGDPELTSSCETKTKS
jgi:hypothetical protein